MTFKAFDASLDLAEVAGDGVPFTFPTGDEAVLRPRGHRIEPRGWARWVFDWEGITLSFAARGDLHPNCPNVVVRLGSIPLMRYGHVAAWEMVCGLLAALGFQLHSAKPGQVDPCVDLLVKPGELVETYLKQWCISRCDKANIRMEGYKPTGMEIGSRGAIQMAAYDKPLELNKAESAESTIKRELLIRNRWGGEIPESAMRVEFRVYREALRDIFDVDSVEDLFKRLPFIVRYLTREWFRLTAGPVDRENKNHQRAEVSGLWLKVQEAFDSCYGREREGPRERVRDALPFDRLLRQAEGVMLTAIARSGDARADMIAWFEATLQRLTEGDEAFVAGLVQSRSWDARQNRLRVRRARIQARVGEYDPGGVVVAPS